jgi:hypothetical protein
MSPPPVNGTLPLGGVYDLRPRESLNLSEPRELVVDRSIPGAYRADGSVAKDTLRAMLESAFTGPVPATLAADNVVEVHDDEVVWGGNIMGHYGHFLTESVSRLWPVLPGARLEGMPVVLTTPKATPFVLQWLEAFGAPVVQLPDRGAVRFTRMVVPEPALRHGAWISPAIRDIHLHVRRGLDVERPATRDVVWLSRSKLGPNRVPYDEGLLEWLIRDHVTVISPETMTVAEQVAALEGSRGVAGVCGSAFHTLLMTDPVPDCLYLCPPWDRQAYPAQHRVLGGKATFVDALSIAASQRRAREGVAFPGAYRLLIPETLRALSATLLPDLLDDPRLAAFADIGSSRRGGGRAFSNELDAAVARMLLDPLAIEPRVELGAMFEAQELTGCALEQSAVVADLAYDRANFQIKSDMDAVAAWETREQPRPGA